MKLNRSTIVGTDHFVQHGTQFSMFTVATSKLWVILIEWSSILLSRRTILVLQDCIVGDSTQSIDYYYYGRINSQFLRDDLVHSFEHLHWMNVDCTSHIRTKCNKDIRRVPPTANSRQKLYSDIGLLQFSTQFFRRQKNCNSIDFRLAHFPCGRFCSYPAIIDHRDIYASLSIPSLSTSSRIIFILHIIIYRIDAQEIRSWFQLKPNSCVICFGYRVYGTVSCIDQHNTGDNVCLCAVLCWARKHRATTTYRSNVKALHTLLLLRRNNKYTSEWSQSHVPVPSDDVIFGFGSAQPFMYINHVQASACVCCVSVPYERRARR